MAYTKKEWVFPDSIETQYTYKGNYGARGEKRAPRRKITPEQIKKQNQWRREQEARRVMKANFAKGDLWCTLLYPRGTRKPMEEVKQDMNRFLSKLRYRYKRLEAPLKFLYRIEIGSRGGIHIHMICNETGCSPPTDMMIQTCPGKWQGEFCSVRRRGRGLSKPVGVSSQGNVGGTGGTGQGAGQGERAKKPDGIFFIKESDPTEAGKEDIQKMDGAEADRGGRKTKTGILHQTGYAHMWD